MDQIKETKYMIMRQCALKAATHLAGKRLEMGIPEILETGEQYYAWLNKPFKESTEKHLCGCGKVMSAKVKKYSEERLGKAMCMDCQKASRV